MNNHAGKVRRSHVVGAYGPGAVADFRPKNARTPVSGVVAGLEEWDERAQNKGISHPQSIHEPRLEKRLGVKGFRLPPVCDETDFSPNDKIAAVRFPTWLQCPRCDRLKRADDWGKEAGNPSRWCPECSGIADQPVNVVPVRFITACERGHLDEFPWKHWAGCTCTQPVLKLKMTGPGLVGKKVICENCVQGRKGRNMEGVFDKDTLGIKCHGKRPWLGVDEPDCPEKPRTLQRGGSNVYWGATLSALDIPPFSVNLGDMFGKYAQDLVDAAPEARVALIKGLKLDEKTGHPVEVLLRALKEWEEGLAASDEEPIEWAEYKQFLAALKGDVDKGEFLGRPEPVPDELESFLGGVVLAHRLREVRALVGFTRINPPSGPFKNYRQKLAKLSLVPLTWLPAIELRGEGIFISLAEQSLRAWESRKDVCDRVSLLEKQIRGDLRDGEEAPPATARFLLLHAFAHALIRQLSLECGYSSSALRERIYAGGPPYGMAGVMIHTGSPDSEGTLGGLVRQGRSHLLIGTVEAALSAMAWCSSDPLCITSTIALSSPRNGAACHACLLVPETSCQHFNNLLDRALLVGTPADPGIGYFRPFLDKT